MAKAQNTAATKPCRIMIVEDKEEMRQLISHRLQREGFFITSTGGGEEALENIELYGLPDLAIVDLCLPGIDGLAVAAALRRSGNMPIVMLSAVDDLETKVAALTYFADDFIVKPFIFAEFLARIRRILLRCWPDSELQSVAVIDARLSVNFYQHYALLDGRRIQLTPTESRLLRELYDHRGQVRSPGALLASVWDASQQSNVSSLWIHIRRLRAKLEPNPEQPYYILTVRRRGYYLAAQQRTQIAKLAAHSAVRAEDLDNDTLFPSFRPVETR